MVRSLKRFLLSESEKRPLMKKRAVMPYNVANRLVPSQYLKVIALAFSLDIRTATGPTFVFAVCVIMVESNRF